MCWFSWFYREILWVVRSGQMSTSYVLRPHHWLKEKQLDRLKMGEEQKLCCHGEVRGHTPRLMESNKVLKLQRQGLSQTERGCKIPCLSYFKEAQRVNSDGPWKLRAADIISLEIRGPAVPQRVHFLTIHSRNCWDRRPARVLRAEIGRKKTQRQPVDWEGTTPSSISRVSM